jgi:ELWxxDGT repeat protein
VSTNNIALFSGQDAFGDVVLWESDGTVAGTKILSVGHTGPVVSLAPYLLDPSNFTAVGGDVFFTGAANPQLATPPALWITNGTFLGTSEIAVTGASPSGLYPTNLTAYNGELVFDGVDTAGYNALWISNGTSTGTFDETQLLGGDDASDLTVSNGSLFFNAVSFGGFTGGVTHNLYEYNSSSGQITGIFAASENEYGLNPSDITSFDGKTYFNGTDAAGHQGLWVTDGVVVSENVPNTSEIAVTGASPSGLDPTNLTVVNGRLLFDGTDSEGRIGLWSSDGTAAGTTEIAPFANPQYLSGVSFNVAQNDFTGTGEAGILWTNSNSDTALWNPNSSGGFAFEDLGIVGGGWQIAGTGAFNGAGEASILWRNADGDTALWNPNGSGGYSFEDLGIVGTSWQIEGTGDFSGDGEGILWRNSNGDTALWNPSDSGGFAFQDLGVVATSWQIAGTGDFTGTGEDSILWRNANGDTELWNPDGSGGFVGQDLGVVGTSWQIAGTGDFEGNGKDSILWRNANGDTELWNPNGSGGFVGEDLGVVGGGWQIVETGDFSGSGQSGILWRNTNGDTELWNPNGSGGFVGQDLGVVGTSWSVHKIFA